MPDPHEARPLRTGLAVLNVGVVMVTAVIVGYWLGRAADTKLGTDPWMMVLGVTLGSAAGFAHLIRATSPPSAGR